jgi:hypothetical protein
VRGTGSMVRIRRPAQNSAFNFSEGVWKKTSTSS